MAFENLIIRARSITKSYGLESVLSDFNLDVWNGSIVGILGHVWLWENNRSEVNCRF
jgi:ABC-type transporter Mla maintaining outer membrane lipid asymmetry ATPase subunit MlaF